MRFSVELGDITGQDSDAIVSPANGYMVMVGGVAGAIKKKGGSLIEEEAKGKAPVKIGKAIITEAGRLKAKYVIHAPTMEIPGRTNEENIYLATLGALESAKENKIKKIAFPCMGTGIGGVFAGKAAKAMRRAFEEKGEGMEIKVVAYSQEIYERFKRIMGD